MGKHRSNKSYGHTITEQSKGMYRISWVNDRYYPNSRLRHPVHRRVITDLKGARGFAKRHGVPFDDPDPPPRQLTDEELIALWLADVKVSDILNHFNMVSKESLRKRARRLGLPPMARGGRDGRPTVQEVLGEDRPALTERSQDAPQIRVAIVKAMRAGHAYTIPELADLTTTPMPRTRSNVAKLVQMGILQAHEPDTPKDLKHYSLNIKG